MKFLLFLARKRAVLLYRTWWKTRALVTNLEALDQAPNFWQCGTRVHGQRFPKTGVYTIPLQIFLSQGYVFWTPDWCMLMYGKIFLDLQAVLCLWGGELAFFQPFCSILGIIHGRFFEVQAGCKSNVSLGKRTRPLVHEVTDSFAVKMFSWFLVNGEFYTRKVLNVTYEDFDWHCVCAWILLRKLSRCRTNHLREFWLREKVPAAFTVLILEEL